MGLDVSIKGLPRVALLGLGSNLGDREGELRGGLRRLEARGTVRVEAVSGLYASEPLEAEGGEFLNAVARVRTVLPADDLLALAKSVERDAGRTGTGHDARPLDIDLLYVDDDRVRGEALELPHPRRWGRAFVVAPLAEVCAALRDPETGRTIADEARRHRAAARPAVARVAGPEWFPGTRKVGS